MIEKAPATKATGAGRVHSPALTWRSLAGPPCGRCPLASRARLRLTKRSQSIRVSENIHLPCHAFENAPRSASRNIKCPNGPPRTRKNQDFRRRFDEVLVYSRLALRGRWGEFGGRWRSVD